MKAQRHERRVEAPLPGTDVLVAGIGNIFMADDAFGPEVISALGARRLPAGVHAADFGIRGMDLAYRLLEGYQAAVFVDATPRGGSPGTLYLIEPDAADTALAPEAHGMDPLKVIALAARLAQADRSVVPRILILGCEPLVCISGDEPDVVVGLSAPVRAAVDEAVEIVLALGAALSEDPTATPFEDPTATPFMT